MMKKSKIIAFIIVVLIAVFGFTFFYTRDSNLVPQSTKLVVDNSINGIPKNFRKTSSLGARAQKDLKDLNLTGLSTLNISGSAQFSQKGLEMIKNDIGSSYAITIVDLRQESHGFINGIPVSLRGNNNKLNKGLSMSEILSRQNKFLESIKVGKTLNLGKKGQIVVNSVQNEKECTAKENLNYIWIPVTDREEPSDNMVHYFINSIKSLPQNKWLHFHCKAGEGRTTTFMAMYDMMKNAKSVSFDDIIYRQYVMGGENLAKKTKNENGNSEKRYNFLKKFYEYCKEKH